MGRRAAAWTATLCGDRVICRDGSSCAGAWDETVCGCLYTMGIWSASKDRPDRRRPLGLVPPDCACHSSGG